MGILGVVMTVGDRTRARTGWRSATYWVVWALLLAGVFALHALADHDAVGVRHASLIASATATAPVVDDAPVGHGSIDLAGEPATVAQAVPAVDLDGVEAACILFLATGAWVLVLLMARTIKRRDGTASSGPHPWHLWHFPVSEPPGLLASAGPLALRL